MKFLFAVLLFLFGSYASAGPAPYIMSVHGASAMNFSPWTVFAGMAGSAYSNSNTCEVSSMTCATAPLCACNSNRVVDGISTLSFEMDPRFVTGKLIMINTGTRSLVYPVSSNGNTIGVDWARLCASANVGATDCGSAGGTFSFGVQMAFDDNSNGMIDSNEGATEVFVGVVNPGTQYDIAGMINNDGILNFAPYPGDQKVYLHDFEMDPSFPYLGYGALAKAVRVYVSDQSLAKANIGEALVTQNFPLDVMGMLNSPVITGLTNGTTYFFRVALVDNAGNVVLNFPGDVSATHPECNAAPGTGCPWAVAPEPVIGTFQ